MGLFINRKSRLDFKWLKSYFIVVLAVSAVLLSYSLVLISQVREAADTNNRVLVNYYCTAIEKNLKGLQDFSSTILYSGKAKELHDFSDKNGLMTEAMSVAYDLVYDIRNFILVNGMVEDIYIYYPDSDCIIGKRGCYNSYAYYKTENISMLPMEEEYLLWMKMLFSNDAGGYQTYFDGIDRSFVFFSLEAKAGNGSQRIIVAKISREQLSSFISYLADGCVFVGLVDENGTVYANGGNSRAFVDEHYRYSSPKDAGKYIVYEAGSEIWPLCLVTVMDFHSAYPIVKLTTIILIWGFIFAVAVGLSIGTFFAVKRKKEMVQIKRRFSDSDDQTVYDDYKYIGMEIDKLLKANQNAVAAAEQQQRMIDSMFLRELLLKPYNTESDVDRLCGLYGIGFDNPVFAIITARGCSASPNVQHTIVEESKNTDFTVLCTHIEQTDVFLCNFEENSEAVQAPVLKLAQRIKEAGQCDVAVSPVITSSSDIYETWREMCRQGSTGVAFADDSEDRNNHFTLLGEFRAAVAQDNLSEAIVLLPELCRKIESGSNENLILCRRHALLCQLYEICGNELARSKLDEILNVQGRKEWEKKLLSFLQDLDLDDNKRIDSRHVADLAKDLIHKEYKNGQLGLQMIAEQIGVSQSYLSRLFKKKYGMSVIQYLNYYRVEQAKILMLRGSDNLKVIAVQVGFSSDVNLIRVFKSFEKMTPGLFRAKGTGENEAAE